MRVAEFISIFPLTTFFLAATIAGHDVLIAVENKIETFSTLKNFSVHVEEAKHIIGLSNPIFMNNEPAGFFATELGVRGPSILKINGTHKSVIADTSGLTGDVPSYFEDVVVDQVTEKLFLTSKNSRAIFTLNLNDNEEKKTPELFLETSSKKPTGISIDTCSRNIYWTNSDRKNPSIEVLQPDTKTSWSLLNTNLTRPRAIDVDISARKLYWTDTNRWTFFISRSNLDGTDREVVCQGKDHEAFSIAVTDEYIFWSDWTSHALWRTPKYGDCTFELIEKFTTSKPHGVTHIPDTPAKCDKYHDIPIIPATIKSTTTAVTTHTPSMTTNSVDFDKACLNYCLQGDCQISLGKTVCECEEGFYGLRCEIDKCTNYCLHSGTCVIVEDEPECLCQNSYQGDRCQITNLGTVTDEKISSLPESCPHNNYILVVSLATVVGILSIIIIVLSIMVHKMRLRPRVVRKRFISVRKEADSEKTGGSCGLPVDDGLQLDIENCCNMTLCDTPCFEPPTRGPSKSKKTCKGAQDKKALLADDDLDF